MHARYILPLKVISHVTSLNWDISNNISLMVQELQCNTNRKSYVAYRMAPLPMLIKVTFAA